MTSNYLQYFGNQKLICPNQGTFVSRLGRSPKNFLQPMLTIYNVLKEYY